MAVPISTVVNVTIAMPPMFPGGTGFSTLMLLGQSATLPLSVRARSYYTTQAVSQDFAATSEEYRASITFFSQNPRPGFLVIGRRVMGPAGGELLGSGNIDTDINHWRGLEQSEILELTIDGTPVTLTNMDFSQVTNMNAVAAVIQQALMNPLRGANHLRIAMTDTDTTVALQAPSTAEIADILQIGDEFMTVMDATDPSNLVVTRGTNDTIATGHNVASLVYIGVSGLMTASIMFNGSAFFLQSGNTGTTSGFSVTNASTLSGMLGFDDGSTVPGVNGQETTAAALEACSARIAFYGVVLTRQFSDAEALEAATWCEGNSRVFGHATGDQLMKDPASETDFASIAQAMALGRTINAYNDPAGLSDYLMVSVLARELATDYSMPNSIGIAKFKQAPGVATSNISLTDKHALDDKYANYYTVFGNVPMFATGVMSDGNWFDQRHGLDFLAQHLADAAFMGFMNSAKIPQTEAGVTYLVGLLEAALMDMVNAGFLAPGTWNGTGVGNVVFTGEFLATGFKVVASPIANQSEIDRMARRAPPITIVLKGSGAIQSVDIFVQFEA